MDKKNFNSRFLKGSDITLLLKHGDLGHSHEVKEAFLRGEDFILESYTCNWRYCSIRNFKPGSFIELRYNRNRCVTYVTVPGKARNVQGSYKNE